MYNSCFPHSFRSVEGLLSGVKPRFELGPALQQADALLSEPRSSTFLSHVTFCRGRLILGERRCVGALHTVRINYLCTYDLYGPARKVFDAGG